jgi:FkbM family methyltransferase
MGSLVSKPVMTLFKIAAGLPTFFKGHILYRLADRTLNMLGQEYRGERVFTNLGVKNGYSVSVPLEKPFFAFGHPKKYRGERGVLYLSKYLGQHVQAVMDVGANWGYHTIFMRPHLDAKIPIYYFEPNKKLFEIIQQNTANNSLENIKGVMVGLSDFTGEASFYVNLSNDMSSSLDKSFRHEWENVVEEKIKVTTFDDFVEEYEKNKSWLVKVDVENAEMAFVRGSKNNFKNIKYLIIELLSKAREEKVADIIMDKFKMNAYYVNDFKLEYMPREDGRNVELEYNFLFCKETPEELRLLLKGTEFTVQ